MSNPAELLAALEAEGYAVAIRQGRLAVMALNGGGVPPEVKERLRIARDKLLAYFSEPSPVRQTHSHQYRDEPWGQICDRCHPRGGCASPRLKCDLCSPELRVGYDTRWDLRVHQGRVHRFSDYGHSN